MAISRMQEPRQLYGLGSLVKKAIRGVKKIVKSPIGKAALLYAGTAGLGALAGGAGGTGFTRAMFSPSGIARNFSSFAPALFANPTSPQDMRNIGFFPKMLSKMSTGQKIFAGLGGAAIATPFLQKAFKMGPYEEIAEEVDESYIDPYTAYMMSRNRAPGLAFLPNEQYVQPNYYLPQNAAEGGRIGYANGNMVEGEMQLPPEAEEYLRKEYVKYKQQGGDLSYPEFKQMVLQAAASEQGPEQEEIMTTEAEVVETPETGIMQMAKGGSVPGTKVAGYTTPAGYNKFDYPSGGKRVAAKEGGLMNLGGLEKDYRTGGFVEIGKEEKADDVPARLSVNEFVFTADAVRNAGDGDIDKGAEVMDNMMKHLEAGGTVSEESQGLKGAQEMYEQSKMLETRIA